jgi:GntR family transcriptional regulator/MocR family aminotransferase
MWLELDGAGPLYRQTYRALRDRILDGALPPGSRLPATRDLARELGLSRNTVIEAYRQLVDEGYAQARIGAGTRVASALPETRTTVDRAHEPGAAPAAPAVPRLSREGRRGLAASPRGGLSWALPRRSLEYDFRYGEPAFGDLPLATWQRLVVRHLRRASARRLAYTPPGGAPELRRALADHLARARGVRCAPEQVVVTRGTQQAIDLVARVLVDPDDRVAIEEPHYSGISLRLAAAGARLVPIPVDEAGMVVSRLERESDLTGVCVTPSHQFPTGGILPLARRAALLERAARSNAFVLEDDYDSEFRYDGRPIECLQGLDRSGRVLYAGSTSKLLFPSLRIGWLVLPVPLVPAFETAQALADTGSATLEQLALASLIEEGGLERHVRRMRVRNGQRRAALLDALTGELGSEARIGGANAGLHVLLELPGMPAQQAPALRRRCEARDVGLYPAAPYYLSPPAHASFVLGYASLDETRIREGVRRIAAALREPDGP